MAFFKDMTPYTYHHPEEEQANTLNVGWLESGCPFPIGATSESFHQALAMICRNRMNRMRGFQSCGFCKSESHRSSAEIRVAIRDRVFAAPELIHHYVVAHNYLPPDEFIEAVLAAADVVGS